MTDRWPTLSLQAAGVSLIDCEHRTPPAATDGYPYVAIPQMKEGRLNLSDARRISAEHFREWTRKAKPQVHDVVLSRRCNPGETSTVPAGLEFALGQNLVLLRADGTQMFPPFLRWWVSSPAWWETVAKFINVGAIFDSLKCADVPKFELPLPPLPKQRAIASILGALDDKIELNRRMNETLEELARTIFKSWFVDFDPVKAKAEGRQPEGMDAETAALFPSRFVESELGMIPEGWGIKSLGNLTSKIGSGATPHGGNSVYVDEGVSLIRSQNVYDRKFVWPGLARITDSAAYQLRGVTVEQDDVLINITGDSILRTCVVDPTVLPARVNQHVSIVRGKKGIPSRFLHEHLLMPRNKDWFLGLDTGGTRKAITKGHLESFRLVVPPVEVLTAFDQLTAAAYQQTIVNTGESRSLEVARDSLLPKLISGELRIPDAEKLTEAVL